MKNEFEANRELAARIDLAVRRESERQLAIAHQAVIGKNALTKREPLRAKLGKVAKREIANAPVKPARFVNW